MRSSPARPRISAGPLPWRWRPRARVTLTDIDAERLEAVAGDIRTAGGSAESVVADLSVPDGWRPLAEAMAAQPPHIFVHSACPRRHESDIALEVSEETFDAMLNTNLRTGFLLGRELARGMIAGNLPGRLLYITSLHAETPRNLPHYSTSKAGMTMLMKELARQLGPAGIRVNAIAPGAIPGGGWDSSASDFQPERKIPLGRFGRAEDIAAAAMALLSDHFSGYITGATIPVDGGLQLFSWIDPPA